MSREKLTLDAQKAIGGHIEPQEEAETEMYILGKESMLPMETSLKDVEKKGRTKMLLLIHPHNI